MHDFVLFVHIIVHVFLYYQECGIIFLPKGIGEGKKNTINRKIKLKN